MLDRDLARLYGVEIEVLNQAVRRNLERFPDDFMFRLTSSEARNWRSSPSRSGRGGRLAFTEQGVAMLSSVLRTGRAIRMNLQVMRAFVRMRALIGRNRAPVFVSYAVSAREPLHPAAPHRPTR